LFTELPLLKRPAAARSAGFDAGRNLTGRVRQTWLRGTALLDPDRGVPDDEPVGRLLNRG
jgi:hypothetical protein